MVDLKNKLKILIFINLMVLFNFEILDNPLQFDKEPMVDGNVPYINAMTISAIFDEDESNLIMVKDDNSVMYNGKSYLLSPNIFLCEDISHKFYLFSENNYYDINPDNGNTIESLTLKDELGADIKYTGYIGCIPEQEINPTNKIAGSVNSENNQVIIYGTTSNGTHLHFSENNIHSIQSDNSRDKPPCKTTINSCYVCAYLQDNKIKVSNIIHIYKDSNQKELKVIKTIEISGFVDYDNLILYDTENINYKILFVFNNEKNIIHYSSIYINVLYDYESNNINDELDTVQIQNPLDITFERKSCYLSTFNSEFLLCYGEGKKIICHRKYNNFNEIKEFSLSLTDTISYLVINDNKEYVTISYKFENSNDDYYYEYYIYPPKCYEITIVINTFQISEINLNDLFERKTTLFPYTTLFRSPSEYGTLKLGDNIIESIDDVIEIKPEMDKLYFESDNYNTVNNLIISYIISISETYSSSCDIHLTIKECHESCKGCTQSKDSSTGDHTNCIKCKEESEYYTSPFDSTDCYTEEYMAYHYPNYYLDKEKKIFVKCHDDCSICNGPTNENCLSCINTLLFFYNGKCNRNCPEGTYKYENSGKRICKECYINCQSCSAVGTDSDMNCDSCSNDKIKYLKNCFVITNDETKEFSDPVNSGQILSCKSKYGKYIIENTYECINMPEEGYYIFNSLTGLLSPCPISCRTCTDFSNCNSCKNDYFLQGGECVLQCSDGYYLNENKCLKCHNNCKTCTSGGVIDENGKLIHMKCLKCNNKLLYEEHNFEPLTPRNRNLQTINGEIGEKIEDQIIMIKNEDNCFPVISYSKTKISFNISEIDPDTKIGNCLYFSKSIFYGEIECIPKPEHTFYVLNNEDNTGVIKNCSIACDFCLGDYTVQDTNCLNCSSGYYKTEDSTTNCILESLIPHNYYKNEIDNIYYKCNPNCYTCTGISVSSLDMNCISCKNGYYKLNGTNNCYDQTFLNEGYYLKDNLFYPCGENCLTCSEGKDDISNNCLTCDNVNKGLYLLEDLNNCKYSNYTGYYLDNDIKKLKRCYNICKTCTGFLEKNIDNNKENHNCIECVDNYYKLGESNCYNNETIGKGYYLDKEENPPVWKECYEKCETCNKFGNSKNMNCLSCKNNLLNEKTLKSYNFILTENGNCIEGCSDNLYLTSIGDCVTGCPNNTYKFTINHACLESCPNNYEINKEQNECILTPIGQNTSSSEFKSQISNNITAFVNSSKVYNGSDFIAVILTTDDLDPKEQLKKGISAIDLGNCTQTIKEHYNISDDESLIVLNMESKKNESSKKEDDKSFDLGKNVQIEVYDKSGRKLNLSICEDIKVMKYIGDVEELDIQSAMNLASKGIDVFNPTDDYFNDICKNYDNNDGKDIIIQDRRTDIYQNVSFCQKGCEYDGMNYELMTANCICDSNSLQTAFWIFSLETYLLHLVLKI